MKSGEDNVQVLSQAILSEAQAETEKLKTEAQANADAIRQRAQAQADAERKAILERASQEADRLRSQAIATAQLKARTLELEQREKLLDQVFDAARKQLQSVPQRKDYEHVVAELLREALLQLKVNEAVISADQATRKVLTSEFLDKMSKDMKVQLSLGKTLDKGTGIVIQAAEGHLQFDNTFETRLARLQGSLRAGTYRVLTGESE